MADNYIKITTDNITEAKVPTKETFEAKLSTKAELAGINTFTDELKLQGNKAKISLPNSVIKNTDSGDNKEDSWYSESDTASISIYNKSSENNYTGLDISKDYAALSYNDASATASASIALSSDSITLSTNSITNNENPVVDIKQLVSLDKDGFKYNGGVVVTSSNAVFENKPKVKTDGTESEVIIKDDLRNFVPVQSEEQNNYYSTIDNSNGQIAFRVFRNGDENDTQNLILTKDSITINNKKINVDDTIGWKTSLPEDTSKILFTRVTINSTNSPDTKILESKSITVSGYSPRGFVQQSVMCSDTLLFFGSVQLYQDSTTSASIVGYTIDLDTIASQQEPTYNRISSDNVTVNLLFEYLW